MRKYYLIGAAFFLVLWLSNILLEWLPIATNKSALIFIIIFVSMYIFQKYIKTDMRYIIILRMKPFVKHWSPVIITLIICVIANMEANDTMTYTIYGTTFAAIVATAYHLVQKDSKCKSD